MIADWRLFLSVTLPLATLGLINQAARTVMAIIGPVLAVEFSLSGRELGLLAASMLAAYAVAQLPDGVALDRLGPRRVQGALSLLAAAGFAVFALSDSLGGFVLARVIIGVGVSAGLIAVIKANTQWFAPAKVARVTGIAVAIGGLGSVLTTAPVQAALPSLGWRGVLWLLCAIAAAVALWIFLSVPDEACGRKAGRTEGRAVGDGIGLPLAALLALRTGGRDTVGPQFHVFGRWLGRGCGRRRRRRPGESE